MDCKTLEQILNDSLAYSDFKAPMITRLERWPEFDHFEDEKNTSLCAAYIVHIDKQWCRRMKTYADVPPHGKVADCRKKHGMPDWMNNIVFVRELSWYPIRAYMRFVSNCC